jgi:hypothetical protein
VIDRDIARASGKRDEVAIASPSIGVDAGKDVVPDLDGLRLAAWVVVVDAQDLHAGRDVSHDVQPEYQVVVRDDLRSRPVPACNLAESPRPEAREPREPENLENSVFCPIVVVGPPAW